jgi:hypothetical protein
MLHSQQIEELICVISALDRASLVKQFLTYQANFPLDFTPEFLNDQPIERLQHIFVAVCLQSQKMPEIAASAA